MIFLSLYGVIIQLDLSLYGVITQLEISCI